MLKRRLSNTKKDKLDTPKSHRVVNLKVKNKRAKADKGKPEIKSKLTDKERKKILKKIMAREEKRNVDSREIGSETEVVERHKRLIMWSGVTFFMVLIAVFWLYNAKQVFQRSGQENQEDFSLASWQELTDELGERMNEMTTEWENIQSLMSTSTETTLGLPESGLNATGTNMELGSEEIEELKRKLEDGMGDGN